MAANEHIANKTGSAGSPLDRIECTFYAGPEHIGISYVGLPADLVAAGAAEPEMVVAGKKGTPRRDSHGDSFRRELRSHGRIRLRRAISSIERACALPGVDPEAIREGVADILWLRQNPGRLRVQVEQHLFVISGTSAALESAGFGRSFGDLPPRGFPVARQCLDGFYSICLVKLESDPNAHRDAIRLAEAVVENASRPLLRLVVDNTRPGDDPPARHGDRLSHRRTDCAPGFTDGSGRPVAGCTESPAPCPFCGAGPNDIAIENCDCGDGVTTFHVQCIGCGCEGPGGMNGAEAAQAWNERPRVRP